MNFISLIIALAIAGIGAAVAIPEWAQINRNSVLDASAQQAYAAESALLRAAQRTTGATLVTQGQSLKVYLYSGQGVFQVGLKPGVVLSINGVPLMSCLAVDAAGLPLSPPTMTTAPIAQCPYVPATTPLHWSVTYEGVTQTVS